MGQSDARSSAVGRPTTRASHEGRSSSAVHVVEIDWTLPLDADVAGHDEDAQRVLDIAEATAEARALPHGDRAAPGP